MRATSAPLLIAIGLFAAALATASQGQSAPASAAALPAAPERALMVRVCSGCHAPEIAAHQRHDRKGWADLVGVMASNGAAATDAELDQITDYLARSFPATEVHAPAT